MLSWLRINWGKLWSEIRRNSKRRQLHRSKVSKKSSGTFRVSVLSLRFWWNLGFGFTLTMKHQQVERKIRQIEAGKDQLVLFQLVFFLPCVQHTKGFKLVLLIFQCYDPFWAKKPVSPKAAQLGINLCQLPHHFIEMLLLEGHSTILLWKVNLNLRRQDRKTMLGFSINRKKLGQGEVARFKRNLRIRKSLWYKMREREQ